MNTPSTSTHIRKPYLLIVGDMTDRTFAKTGLGLRDWCAEDCVGQLRFNPYAVDLGLPDLSIAEAAAAGAKTAVIAISPPGGNLPSGWVTALHSAMEAGMDIASGLHSRLQDIPELAESAQVTGRTLHNVRLSAANFDIGTGRKRSGKRMLMVGTDCAVGKKYSALAIARALQNNGIKATFRATGQTGILIAGQGVAVDAVKTDFISGAAESLSPNNAPDHWDIVEGQGSLFHPSFAAVTLGLVHGSQPDLMVLCHKVDRDHISGLPEYQVPDLMTAIPLYTTVARLTNPAARVVAISLNCSAVSTERAQEALAQAEATTGLVAFDPLAEDFARTTMQRIDFG